MLHVHEFGLKANQVNHWYLASVHTNKLRVEGGRLNNQTCTCVRNVPVQLLQKELQGRPRNLDL